jgi:hypothetical protein
MVFNPASRLALYILFSSTIAASLSKWRLSMSFWRDGMPVMESGTFTASLFTHGNAAAAATATLENQRFALPTLAFPSWINSGTLSNLVPATGGKLAKLPMQSIACGL